MTEKFDIEKVKFDDLPVGLNYKVTERANGNYPLVYENVSTVFDYIDGTVIFSDYSDILNTAAGITSQYNEDIKVLLEDNE